MALHFRLLSCLSFAVAAQAQGCSRPLGGPNMDLKDNDILLEAFPDGTRVAFICNIGYTSAGGSGAATCTAGAWGPVTLKCERKSCGSAGEVDNGHVNYTTGIEFGDRIVISCNTGYTLVGNREVTCGDRGWMGRLPLCEVVVCDPPPPVADGAFDPDKDEYLYGEVVRYNCQKDFTLAGAEVLSCSEDGTFRPEAPECVKVNCEEPDIDNAEWIGGSRPPHGHMALTMFSCLAGFKMNGSASLVCGIDSSWSPALPTCETVACLSPPAVANGTFGPERASYRYGDAVQYVCETGFILSGPEQLSCSDEGTFKPAPPTCTRAPAPATPRPPTTTPGSDGNSVAKGVGGSVAANVMMVTLVQRYLA
ncbi:C4b-binding protein alpha chain-like isoform X2 [Brachionichthys hirsutus]|uniref:C4b-binding protein alpha chain-like isoform X2 n=1 Tax=Brachionichthys hirsutus TaxID=412623 RepID=UPI003604642C